MKHYKLYKILSLFEEIIMTLLFITCFIIYISEPTSGIWSLKFIASKLIALGVMIIIYLIEKD